MSCPVSWRVVVASIAHDIASLLLLRFAGVTLRRDEDSDQRLSGRSLAGRHQRRGLPAYRHRDTPGCLARSVDGSGARPPSGCSGPLTCALGPGSRPNSVQARAVSMRSATPTCKVAPAADKRAPEASNPSTTQKYAHLAHDQCRLTADRLAGDFPPRSPDPAQRSRRYVRNA